MGRGRRAGRPGPRLPAGRRTTGRRSGPARTCRSSCTSTSTYREPKIDEAERTIVALGAKLVQHDDGKRDWRVYLDPAGHPFCLCLR